MLCFGVVVVFATPVQILCVNRGATFGPFAFFKVLICGFFSHHGGSGLSQPVQSVSGSLDAMFASSKCLVL